MIRIAGPAPLGYNYHTSLGWVGLFALLAVSATPRFAKKGFLRTLENSCANLYCRTQGPSYAACHMVIRLLLL